MTRRRETSCWSSDLLTSVVRDHAIEVIDFSRIVWWIPGSGTQVILLFFCLGVGAADRIRSNLGVVVPTTSVTVATVAIEEVVCTIGCLLAAPCAERVVCKESALVLLHWLKGLK